MCSAMIVRGGCHCGDVRYQATVDPERVVICHCTDCQKLAASAFRTIAMIRDKDFELTEGAPKIYVKTAASGRLREQVFCERCGTQLYSSSVEPGPRDIGLRVGTIDNPTELKPRLQIWTRSKLPWIDDIASIPDEPVDFTSPDRSVPTDYEALSSTPLDADVHGEQGTAVDFLLAHYAQGLRDDREAYDRMLVRIDKTELIEELIDQRDRAEAAVLEKNRFLATASHDLRQPLHAIGMYLHVLQSKLTDDSSLDLLARINQSLQKLGRFLSGLLELSRLEAKVVECRPQDLNVAGLIGRLLQEYSLAAVNKRVLLTVDMTPAISVHADEQLLYRVLENLLSNAIEYTDEGSITLRVSESAPGLACIAVSDTGRGIPADMQASIFDDYLHPGDASREQHPGMGLGLSIVKRLCDLMGAPISVNSTEGVGSSFSLFLPLSSAAPESEVVSPAPADTQTLKGKRIMVIDDDTSILDGTKALLADSGCELSLSDSKEGALSAVQSFGCPDVILADYRLGDNTTGLEVIDLIRDGFNAMIPAILVTGETSVQSVQEASTASVTLLHKPVSLDVLKSSLVSACAS